MKASEEWLDYYSYSTSTNLEIKIRTSRYLS